ncbi:MAG: adenylate/guanylate cyclase domain-containing protein [Bacteroidales bacterium]|nr:adenylate/guanylate cyclase domain-containing protein [Bacteroidales bacterium]
MKPEQKRRYGQQLRTSMISALMTAIFMYLFYYPGWRSIGAGLAIGGTMPLILELYTKFFYNRYLAKANLLIALFVNSAIHLLILIIVALLFVGIFYLNGDYKTLLSDFRFFYSHYFLIGIGFGLVLTVGFNFFSILNTLIGKHILGKLLIGMYRQPREVERVFMFLDITSSTSIAEQIGPKKFMSLVNDFFYDITEAVFQSKGEIYKYVGDEVIITWKTPDAITSANCIRCFINIRHRISQKSSYYQKTYGVIPNFKAGIHGGVAITGELGYTRREIAYMGDVLNTTARIEEACKTFSKSLLLSETMFHQLESKGDFKYDLVGEVKLRGKEKTTKLYSLLD